MTKAAKILWFLCLAIFLGWLTHRAFSQTFQRSLPFLAKQTVTQTVPFGIHDKYYHLIADSTNIFNQYGTTPTNGQPVWSWRNEEDAYTNFGAFRHGTCVAGEASSENFLAGLGPTGGGVVQITGGDQLMQWGGCSGDADYTPTNPLTMFFVMKCTNATSFQIFWYGYNNHPYIRADFTAGNNPGFSVIAANVDDTVHAVPCNINVLTNWTVVTVYINTNNCYIRTNGVNCGTSFNTSGGSYYSTGNLIAPISFQWQGYLAEIIEYEGSILTTNDLQIVENNLKTKYGL